MYHKVSLNTNNVYYYTNYVKILKNPNKNALFENTKNEHQEKNQGDDRPFGRVLGCLVGYFAILWTGNFGTFGSNFYSLLLYFDDFGSLLLLSLWSN